MEKNKIDKLVLNMNKLLMWAENKNIYEEKCENENISKEKFENEVHIYEETKTKD